MIAPKYTCIVFLGLFLAGLAAAQENSPPVSLSLSQAIEEAMATNPLLRVAQARLDEAVSKTTEARSALLPQLKLSGRAAYLSEVPEFTLTLPFIGTQTLFPSIVHSYGARLTLQQTLFAGFRVRKSLEMAEHHASAAEFDRERDRSDLRLTVTTTYWNLYRTRRLEQVLAKTVEQVSSHLEDVNNFRKQGMATDLDVLKVETRLSDIRVKHMEARSNASVAQMMLNSLLSRPLQTELSLSDVPVVEQVPPVEENVAEYMRRAREGRAEIAAARERRAMQEAAVVAARGGWYPQIVLLGNFDIARPNPRIIPPKDAWEQSWDVGVSVQWNVWDWFATDSRTSQARAGLAQTEAMVRRVDDAVALEAARSYFRLAEVKERIDVATLGIRQAEESFRITKERFAQGVSTNADLLDAETELLQARLNETQAVVDFAIEKEKLKKAIGEDSL